MMRTQLTFGAFWFCVGLTTASGQDSWSPELAKSYLDKRSSDWASWSRSNRGEGTYCVSRHTGVANTNALITAS